LFISTSPPSHRHITMFPLRRDFVSFRRLHWKRVRIYTERLWRKIRCLEDATERPMRNVAKGRAVLWSLVKFAIQTTEITTHFQVQRYVRMVTLLIGGLCDDVIQSLSSSWAAAVSKWRIWGEKPPLTVHFTVNYIMKVFLSYLKFRYCLKVGSISIVIVKKTQLATFFRANESPCLQCICTSQWPPSLLFNRINISSFNWDVIEDV
jgi:hypothetical protein